MSDIEYLQKLRDQAAWKAGFLTAYYFVAVVCATFGVIMEFVSLFNHDGYLGVVGVAVTAVSATCMPILCGRIASYEDEEQSLNNHIDNHLFNRPIEEL